MKRFKIPKKVGINLQRDTKLLNKVISQEKNYRWQNFFKKKQTENPLIKATKSYSLKQGIEKLIKTHFSVRKNKYWIKIKRELKKRKNGIYVGDFWKTRLEILLWESTFCKTVNEARQKITKGHVKINNKQVTSETYKVKPGDIVTIETKSKKEFKKYKVVTEVPDYLEISFSTHSIILAFNPIKKTKKYFFY